MEGLQLELKINEFSRNPLQQTTSENRGQNPKRAKNKEEQNDNSSKLFQAWWSKQNCRIVARATPQQKFMLVKQLQMMGEVVAVNHN